MSRHAAPAPGDDLPTRDERHSAAQSAVRLILDALEIEGRVRAVAGSGRRVVTRFDGVLVEINVSTPLVAKTWSAAGGKR